MGARVSRFVILWMANELYIISIECECVRIWKKEIIFTFLTHPVTKMLAIAVISFQQDNINCDKLASSQDELNLSSRPYYGLDIQ